MDQGNALSARIGADDEDSYEGFDLDRYKSMWQQWVDDYGPARKQNFRDEEYYDGDIKGTGEGQWTAPELEELKSRGQPPSVHNIIKRKINGIAGVEKRTRSEPRAQPRNPQDQKAAEIATDSLRFVKEQARWPSIKATLFLEAIKIGYAAIEIGLAKNHVPLTPIAWKEFFFDPRSRRHDFSDARFMGIAKWVDEDVAKTSYAPEPQRPELDPPPEDPAFQEEYDAYVAQAEAAFAEEEARRTAIIKVIEDTTEGDKPGTGTDTDFDDLPSIAFGDKKRKRIFIVDMWHQDPKKGWFRCVFTGKGKLFTEESTYIVPDQYGRKAPACPILAFSIYVSKNLWRYGEVRDLRPVQTSYNKRRSKALHQLTVNQVIADVGAIPDGNIEAARAEAARPDGWIEKRQGAELRIERGGELAAGQMQMAQDDKEYLELAGANQQLQGQAGGADSGRAIIALQTAGLGQLGPVFDASEDFDNRCFRTFWARIQQGWDGPMYVRVTDDKNAARFAAVNGAPVIDANNGSLPQGPEQNPMLGHNGGPAMDDPMAGALGAPNPNGPPMSGGAMAPNPMMAPGAPADVNAQNQGPQETGPMLAELDMDIIVTRAPEAAVLEQEQFNAIMQIVPVYLQNGQPVPLEAVIEASSLPKKSEFLDALKAAKAEPNPAAQMQQQMGQVQLELLMKKIEELNAKIENIKADTAGKGATAGKTQAEARSASAAATMDEIETGVASGLLSTLNGSNAPQAFPAAGGTGEFGPPL